MIDITLISTIVGFFIGIGALFAGIGFAYAQFKSGGDKYKDNLILTLKETAEAERAERERVAKEKTELLISHQGQITELTKQISELKGRFIEQEKKAVEYKDMLMGRDPQLQQTLSEIRAFLKTLSEQQNKKEVMTKTTYKK